MSEVIVVLVDATDPESPLEVTVQEESPIQVIIGSDSGGGGSAFIGAPTDGAFGSAGGVSGLLSSDLIADGFDKVEVILEKLAPPKPANLSDVSLTLAAQYSALEATTGTLRTTVTSDTTPTLTAADFYDGDAGTLTTTIDGAASGSLPITTGDDSGTSNAALAITVDEDPFAGVFGKETFWRQLTATITPTAPLSFAPHTFDMTHSTTGTTPVFTAYVDNPGVPVVSNETASSAGAASYISGVPGLAVGQTISVAFDVDNAVSKFYNSTQVGRASSAETSTTNFNPAAPPAEGATLSFAGSVTVLTNKYTESWTGTATGFASDGTTGVGTITPTVPIRIDTISDESARSTSGTGQFPAAGYNAAFDSTELLTASEELQLLAGNYQFPPAVSYAGKYPAGPNYSAIAGGSYLTHRWATFDLGAVAAASFVTINLLGATGIASVLQAGMLLYVKVEGATGWLDANAAYPGVGSPAADGDPAVVVGSSTATSRKVTFGATVRSGSVIARIGFPSGSTKTFTGITRS